MTRLLSLVSIIVLSACDRGATAAVPDLAGSGGDGGAGYPAGPYGTDVGSIIDNITIAGTQHDDNMSGSPTDDVVRTIHLADYHNDKKVKVLVVLVGAFWCVPCQTEQSEVVPAYQAYKSKNAGVAFLEAVTQKQDGSPADQATVDTWAAKYMLPFDVTFDPTYALAPYSNSMVYPSQLVIRTSDMSIQWAHNGYTAGALETAIDAALVAQ